MNAKEKADDLINKIIWNTLTSKRVAKICALIAVDELLQDHLQDQTDTKFYYWQEVKKQIELL